MYYKKKVIRTETDRLKYKKLLEKSDLVYENNDFEFGVFEEEVLVGAIAISKNCIKGICIDEAYQGEGIAQSLVSEIIHYAKSKNIIDLFVYTKPKYEAIFNSLGFYTILKIDKVLFLENKRDGVTRYCEELKKSYVKKPRIGALVMNLNPITNGHLYLIKKAVSEVDHVHLFLVKEDRSSFPYEVRLNLLKKSVEGINNLTIHSGSDYIISSATFPTYFIKNIEDIDKSYPQLDVGIFGKYIANALGISVRYVGTEPYSKTTNIYNQVLKEELPKYNIEVKEIERSKANNDIVSASKVREMIKNDNIEGTLSMVPLPVFEYLKSEESLEVRDKIKKSSNRH